jgi:exocyst complex protein 7
VDEQEMENYLVCVMALQRLMQSERSLMVGIVPLQHQHQVFEIIIRDAMDMVVQDGEVQLFLQDYKLRRNKFSKHC